jgi:membrane-associated phospholipid phosphatase
MERRAVAIRFLFTGLVLAAPAAYGLWAIGGLDLHARVNAVHRPWADAFFAHVTHLADGLVPTVLALALLFIATWRSFLMMALSTGLSAIVVQVLKHFVFAHRHRPAMFRDQLPAGLWVEGVDLHHHHAFPSGHATAAFAMCFALAIIVGRPRWAVPFALLAGVLAFSRVYLSQHFTEDILAGAGLGTLTAALVYGWLYTAPFASRAWLDRRPFRGLR